MKKRVLFIIIFMMLWLLPGGVAFAYTYGFNTEEAEAEANNTISELNSGNTLQITSSDNQDYVTNWSITLDVVTSDHDLMDGLAVYVAYLEGGSVNKKPHGTITVSLTSGKAFTVNSFVCGNGGAEDTLKIDNGSTNQTFTVEGFKNKLIEPNAAFAGITSFTMSWNNDNEMYFDNFIITPVTAPVITLKPSNTIAVSGNASFSVEAVGNILTYQWQVDTTGVGSNFTNITNDGIYGGATTSMLSITGATGAMNGYLYRCIVTSNDGGTFNTESDYGILTVNTPASISVQPTDTTVNVGNNTSFSVTAAGTAPLNYQWQVDTTGAGSSFTNISNGGVYSGATTSTLSITGATGAMNGYVYRVVVTGTSAIPANIVNSDNAVLTVNTYPVINTQPADTTVNQGSNTSFTVGASGASLTYQWQVDSGSGFTNIADSGVYSGSTTTTLQITGATLGMNGYQYQCIVTGAGSLSKTSSAATLTLNIPVSISVQPVAKIVNVDNNTSFSVTAAGTAPLTYQWQVDTTGAGSSFTNVSNGGVYSGATTSTLSITGATGAMNGYVYRVVVTGTSAISNNTINSSNAGLTVNTYPVIDTQPANATVNQGSNSSFTVGASGTSLIYQWQVNTGSGFTNISDSVVYSGSTTTTLQITGATLGMNGYQYRCIVTGVGSLSKTSSAATLTLNIPVSISAQPVAKTVNVGNNTTFTVTAAGTAPLTYQWQVDTTGAGSSFTNISNGGVYSGATTSTLSITGATGAMNGYVYRVVVTGTSAISNNSINSSNAGLTVNTYPVIDTQPANATVNQGSNTFFMVGASGTSLIYQWQVNTGSGFTNISDSVVYSGSATPTLQITGATLGMNGYQYQCIVTGVGSLSTPSSAATLTLNIPVGISVQPVAKTVNVGNNTSFSVTAAGTAPLTYQWQVDTTGAGSSFTNITNAGIYSGATTSTLSITGATGEMNGYVYRVVVTGTSAISDNTINSSNAGLTVNTYPVINTQPVNATVNQGSNSSFMVGASGASLTYQWQVDTGSGFTDISNGGIYSGSTTTTLQITGASLGINGYQYRCIVTGVGSLSTPSSAATLTLNIPVSISVQPVAKTVNGGSNTSFSVTAAGTAPLTYQWQVDTTGAGSSFTNITNAGIYSEATTATLNITGATAAMNGYVYRVVVTGTSAIAGNTVTSNTAQLTVRPTYIITYIGTNSTSGFVPLDNSAYIEGATAIIKNNSGNLARSGYSFAGWNTSSNGSGTKYLAGDNLVIGKEDITLYAQWTLNPTPPSPPTPPTPPAPSLDDTVPRMDDNKDSQNNTEGWNNIVEKLAETKDDTSYSIDLKGGSLIPVTILEAVKGKNVDVAINLGNGIEWIINGTDIQDDQDDQVEDDPTQQPKTINLQVSVVTDTIPKDALANLETQDSIELSLAYTGDFGFKATLKMTITEENRGKIANLFYYNPNTQKLELQGACKVDSNGNILLDFTHASDYIIVMDDKVIIEDAIKLVSMPIQSSTLYVGGTKGKSVKLKLNIPDSIKQVIEDGLSEGSITYSSSNPKVAKVSADGKVSAIAAGKTTITTTIVIDGISRSFKTKINVKKAHIVISKQLNDMTVGDTFTFVATGYGVDTKEIVWTTEKRSILVINRKTGKARAGSVGTDYVIVKAGGITTRIKVVISNK